MKNGGIIDVFRICSSCLGEAKYIFLQVKIRQKLILSF